MDSGRVDTGAPLAAGLKFFRRAPNNQEAALCPGRCRRGYTGPYMREYDLLIIGSGPAGHHGAIQAAKLGKRVGMIEIRSVPGGACIHTGTIPSKTLREAVLHLAGMKQRGLYGIGYERVSNFSMDDLTGRVDQVVRTEVGVFIDHFRRNEVEVITGKASFVDSHVVQVDSPAAHIKCRAEKILIAAGTRPAHDTSIPFDDQRIFDTDALLRLPELPKLLTIVGGGVIGVEYACMAAAL